MARLNNMMADGGGIPASYVPEDSVARNSVVNAATTPSSPVVDTRIALGKLQSGQTLTDEEKRSLGLSTSPTKNPVVVEPDKPVGAKVPDGFIEGPFPSELEQFFGPSTGYVGYKIETLTDKDGVPYFRLSVATSPTSSQTFGAGFTKDSNGKYVPYAPSAGSSSTSSTTKLKTDAQIAADTLAAEKKAARKSAYDLLYQQFDMYGLGALVTPLKDLIESGVSPSEFTIKLRETEAYKKRFAANAKRIANGFAAIDEATYLALEDKYQSIMQNYGLPASYYAKGDMGVQQGFEDLIAGNVDAVTLEERILEGQKVLKGNKLILDAAKKFFPELTDADFLGYVLNPKNALSDIKRKVTAAEIGGAQLGAGLEATAAGAEALATAGVTGQRYQQAAPTIAEAATRGSQLAAMFGESPYTQQTAEQAILNVPGSAEALKQTKKLTALEQAEFSKKSGVGILSRERSGAL